MLYGVPVYTLTTRDVRGRLKASWLRPRRSPQAPLRLFTTSLVFKGRLGSFGGGSCAVSSAWSSAPAAVCCCCTSSTLPPSRCSHGSARSCRCCATRCRTSGPASWSWDTWGCWGSQSPASACPSGWTPWTGSRPPPTWIYCSRFAPCFHKTGTSVLETSSATTNIASITSDITSLGS